MPHRWRQIDHKGLAPHIETQPAFTWITGDAAPTDPGIADQKRAFRDVRDGYRSMRYAAKASYPPFQALCEMLRAFGEFFRLSDTTDEEGDDYADFLVKPFRNFLLVRCKSFRRLALLDTSLMTVVFEFDPFTGSGRKTLILYLRDWVLHTWDSNEPDLKPVRPYPFSNKCVPVAVSTGPAHLPPPKPRKRNNIRKAKMTPLSTLDGNQVLITRALQKCSNYKRRHHPYARPAAAARSTLCQVAIPEETASDVEGEHD